MSEVPVRMTIDRSLEYWPPGATEPRSIRVSITFPEPHPRFDWTATLMVYGFDEPYSKSFYGCDAIHVLTLTLGVVPSVLQYLSRAAPGRITWQGSDDLRFPSLPAFGEDGGDAVDENA